MADIEGHTFSPKLPNGTRLNLRISPEDLVQIEPGTRWSCLVTDLPTGAKYWAREAMCSHGGCMCDAIVEPVGTH